MSSVQSAGSTQTSPDNMAGKLKLRMKKKYRKMQPENEQILLQEEVTQEEVCSSQQEPPGQPEHSKNKKSKKKKKKKKKQERSSKQVHLSPLPDKYDPLEETAEEHESKEDKKYKRKQKVKKYAKNVGKAVRTGCRYLILGMQGLANAYVSPFGVSTVVLSSMSR